MTQTIEELHQQLEDARRAEEQRQAAEYAAAQQRELDYRRQRLASYDRTALTREVRQAHAAFVDALAADPVFAAFIDAQAARWREYRAAEVAHQDRAWIARAEGSTPPHDSGTRAPQPLSADALLSAVGTLLAERIEAQTAEVDAQFAAAVFGEGLTPEQLLEAEAQAEAARRRESARSATGGSTDVTGMSDADRAALGLPLGSSRTERG